MTDNADETPKARSRPSITIDQKKKILEEYDKRRSQGTSSTQKDLALWASQNLSIPMPSQSAISKMLKSRQEIQKSECLPAAKRMSGVTCSRLERALVAWINDCLARKQNISDRLIQEKADRVVQLVNSKLPSQNALSLKFSQGWLHKFKKRHSFKKWKRLSDTKPVVPLVRPAAGLPLNSICSLVSEYQPRDIFNVSEFGLDYSMPPDRAATIQQSTQRNPSSARLTCVVCCNADGTERIPLTIIGTCPNPLSMAASSNRVADDGEYDYHSNANAWMTADLFLDWLEKFDKRMSNQSGRSVCLLVDDSEVHGNADSVPALEHTKMVYLARDSADVSQPLENSIIKALKCRYRRRQLEQALDLLDIGFENIYAVDLQLAMHWLEEEWQKLPTVVVQVAWKISRLLRTSSLPDEFEQSDHSQTDDVGVVEQLLCKLVPESRRIHLDVLLSHDNNNIVGGELTDEMLAEDVVEERMTDIDDDHGPEDEPALPSLRRQAQALALVKLIMSRRGITCETTTRVLNELHESVREEEADL